MENVDEVEDVDVDREDAAVEIGASLCALWLFGTTPAGMR